MPSKGTPGGGDKGKGKGLKMPALQGYYNFLTGHKQRRGAMEEEEGAQAKAGGDGTVSSRGRGAESPSPSQTNRSASGGSSRSTPTASRKGSSRSTPNASRTSSTSTPANLATNSEPSKGSSAVKPFSHRDDDHTPVKKGECPLCEEAVYANEFRQYVNGAYYHEECISENNKRKNSVTQETAACKQQLASTTASSPSGSSVQMRGTCDVCEKGVFTNEPRKFEHGKYYHEDCFASLVEAASEANTAADKKDISKATVCQANGSPVRRGECGVCQIGVYTNQSRKFENGVYYHEECLSLSKISNDATAALTGGVQASDVSERVVESALKRTRVMKEILGAAPTTARVDEDVPIPTVRFSEDVVDRGVCGVCDNSVLTDQLRTFKNGCYFHDECLLAAVSKRLTDLNAHDSLLSHERERNEVDPTRALKMRNETEIAGVETGKAASGSLRTHAEHSSPQSVSSSTLSSMLEDCTSPLRERRQTKMGVSPSKSLVECCASLATANTPRYEDLFNAEENYVEPLADEKSEVHIVNSTPCTIIPDQFLHRSRSPTRTAYPAEQATGKASRISTASQMSLASEMLMETKSSSTSELDTFELLQSMNAVKGSLETSAEQVQGIVNTPRMLAAQIAKLKLEDEAQLLVFQSLESVLKQVQTAESSMSDDELANVLEELGKIAETWVIDRGKLVNDLEQARKESEEMKNLALTACYEASSVVDRAQSQAKSRLEAKKRVKAENKVLQEQNIALMNACTQLTEEHAADLAQISEGLNMAKEETLRIRTRMEHKLEVMSCILMKTIVVEIPFRQWRAFVHDVRSEKLAQQSQEFVRDREEKGSTVHQEELQGPEETKEVLLKIWAAETKSLTQQHEEQVALLRAQHQNECAQMREEHERAISRYKAEIEVLREILQLKLEAISVRLMRNILLDLPFKGWAARAMRKKRIAGVRSKVEVRDRLLVLSKGFISWETAIPSTSNDESNHADKTIPLAHHADAKAHAELQTASELSALKTPPQAHDPHQLLKSQERSTACRMLESCLSAADVTSSNEARTGIASAEQGANMNFSQGPNMLVSSPLVTGKEAEFGSKRSPTSSSTSFVASGSLYSSVSEVEDNRSVSSSSCMRSSRSTRSSVWASNTRVGIGAYFQRSETMPDTLEVKRILPNSPAAACKLVSVGDAIVAVDGELVGGKSLSQLAEKVLGTPNSIVECSFRKKETSELYSVTLVRGVSAS